MAKLLEVMCLASPACVTLLLDTATIPEDSCPEFFFLRWWSRRRDGDPGLSRRRGRSALAVLHRPSYWTKWLRALCGQSDVSLVSVGRHRSCLRHRAAARITDAAAEHLNGLRVANAPRSQANRRGQIRLFLARGVNRSGGGVRYPYRTGIELTQQRESLEER